MPAILLVAVGWSTASAARSAEWHTYQHDVQHTGRSAANFDPRTLALAWTAPEEYHVPLIVGDSVIGMKSSFGGAEPDYITSFRLSDGGVNWTQTANYYFPSPMTYASGMLVYSATDSTTFDNRLYVRDAATGALRYSLPLDNWISSSITIGPPVGTNPSPVAYLASHADITAVRLGPSSASVLWTRTGSFGGDSSPTIAGDSVLVAGPGQYYAFSRTNGAMNHFHRGDISGGGGTTVAYDAALRNFYVVETFNDPDNVLTAYRLNSNSNITQLWQRTDLSYGEGAASVAIGEDGKIYLADHDRLLEISPTDGATLRFLENQDFASGVTPILQEGYLWAFTEEQTLAFDLATFTLARTLPGSRGSLNSPINSAGAIGDDYFIVDYGFVGDEPGFDVYRAPSPPMPGDANGDSVVDRRDLAMLTAEFGRAAGASWSHGDFNGDGLVNLVDLMTLRNHLAQAASPQASVAASAAVPEPSSPALLATGAIGLLFARRIRRGRHESGGRLHGLMAVVPPQSSAAAWEAVPWRRRADNIATKGQSQLAR